MKTMGSVSRGSFHWVLNTCCYKRASRQATQVKGGWSEDLRPEKPHHCNNPESTSWWERTSNAIDTDEDSGWKSKSTHVWHFSHEIHTPTQSFMCIESCMNEAQKWLTGSLKSCWMSNTKTGNFLLGSRFWQAEPQSKLSLLKRIHQIIPPYAPVINYLC